MSKEPKSHGNDPLKSQNGQESKLRHQTTPQTGAASRPSSEFLNLKNIEGKIEMIDEKKQDERTKENNRFKWDLSKNKYFQATSYEPAADVDLLNPPKKSVLKSKSRFTQTKSASKTQEEKKKQASTIEELLQEHLRAVTRFENASHFSTLWKSANSSEKWHCLRNWKDFLDFKRIFTTGVPTELFAEIISSLPKNKSEEAENVAKVLGSLSEIPRIQLTLKFLAPKEKRTLRESINYYMAAGNQQAWAKLSAKFAEMKV